MKNNSIVAKKKSATTEVPFLMIPQADLMWVMEQKPAVIRLFHECWLADPYGSRWMQLTTKLKSTAFTEAKKQLSDQGLFIFKRETSIRDGRSTVCWMVKNLHGSRIKDFWKETAIAEPSTADGENNIAQTEAVTAPAEIDFAPAKSILPETQTQQDFQDASTSAQKRFINTSSTPQRVDEVYEDNPPVTQPPLEGASAPGSVEEKELSCNADLTSGIHNAPIGFPFQVGEQITLSWPGTEYDRRTGVIRKLYVESREVDVQMEGQGAVFCFSMSKVLGSTVSEQPTRSNSDHAQKRKARRSRLKNADMFGECPGFEFLVECWEDVVLRSQVKSLVAKYPHWGFKFP